MNLVIDIGNTRSKWAVFDRNLLVKKGLVNQISTALLSGLFTEFPGIDNAILAAVREFPDECRNFIASKTTVFTELTHETPVPITNCYKSPETLGLDRLAAAIGGTSLFPATPLLIIDAGTAITIDLVSSKNEYLGGNISPGLQTRFSALNRFTGKLPLVSLKDDFEMIGYNTESAIRAGVQQGVIFETEGYIHHFAEKYSGLKVLLTGGDSTFLLQHLKSKTTFLPDLTLTGLNTILTSNSATPRS
jgi:type III pantothenate kinase